MSDKDVIMEITSKVRVKLLDGSIVNFDITCNWSEYDSGVLVIYYNGDRIATFASGEWQYIRRIK